MDVEEFRESLLRVIRKNIEESGNGVILTIRVENDSTENYIVIEGDEVVFKTRDFNDANRCNSALIGYLSRALKVPSSKIDIIHGCRGGVIKKVLIKDIRPEELENKILRIARLI
ncbi:MAG: DUF167 family protein [Desulfurococcaceae archaeon]